MIGRSHVLLLPLLFFAICTTAAVAEKDIPPYLVSVLPRNSPINMHFNWMPFLERLSKETGLKFQLKLYEKMDQFEADVKKGTPDFIFATPPQTVVGRRYQGYQPLVRGSRKLTGILFVRADSPIKTAEELKDKDIAFVGARNLCSIIIRHVLSQQHVALRFKPIISGSTNNVYMNVILGKAAAGATLDADIEQEPKEIQSQLRIIVKTDPLAPHPLSVHPRVPKHVHAKVTKAIFAMSADDTGARQLAAVLLANPVQAKYETDYKYIESIDIEGLSTQF